MNVPYNAQVPRSQHVELDVDLSQAFEYHAFLKYAGGAISSFVFYKILLCWFNDPSLDQEFLGTSLK
jgi:hypothetical protein